jgi:hypothetical protein
MPAALLLSTEPTSRSEIEWILPRLLLKQIIGPSDQKHLRRLVANDDIQEEAPNDSISSKIPGMKGPTHKEPIGCFLPETPTAQRSGREGQISSISSEIPNAGTPQTRGSNGSISSETNSTRRRMSRLVPLVPKSHWASFIGTNSESVPKVPKLPHLSPRRSESRVVPEVPKFLRRLQRSLAVASAGNPSAR